MKRIAFVVFSLVLGFQCAYAQYVTNNITYVGENEDLSFKIDYVRIDESGTQISFTFTAKKRLRGLWVYNGTSTWGINCPYLLAKPRTVPSGENIETYSFGSKLIGCLGTNGITNIEVYRARGWDNVPKGETRRMVLCFGPIPESLENITLVNFTLEYNNTCRYWEIPLTGLRNPRKNYVPLVTESAIKEHLDVNNDGICGIYEEVGSKIRTKYACVKHNGKHSLIFLSDNLGRSWWKTGDIKAILQETATKGFFQATWFMSDKSKNENVYVAFDGTSMTASFNAGTSNVSESKYIKMYPTEAPAYEKIDEAVEELKNENYQSAIKMLSNIISSKATDNEHRYYAYMLRAYAYRAVELYKSAIEDYTSALKHRPGDEDAYYERGQLKLYLGDVTGIDDLKRSGEFGRALLLEYDLLDYDTSKPIQKEQAPPLKKQSIPQLKKTNR